MVKGRFFSAILFIAILLSSCKIGVPIVTDVNNFQFVTGKKGELGFQADIKVNNPNSFGITIKKLKFDVFMDGVPMGTATGGKKIRIKGLTNDYHTVYLKSDGKQMAGMGMNIFGMLTGKMSDIRIQGGGKGCVFCFVCKKFEAEHQERVRLNGF